MTRAPAPDEPPTLRARGAADLLALLPYLLGFHPTDGLVVAGLRDTRVVFLYRVDLRAGLEPDRVTAMLATQALTGVVLVGFGADEDVGPAVDALASALTRSGQPVLDRLRATADRFWSYACTDPACCPPEGHPYRSERIAAAAARAGLTVAPDRAALVRRIAPVTGAARVAMERATHRAEAYAQSLVDDAADPSGAVDRILAEGTTAVRTAIDRYQADADAHLTDDEVAWLGVALSATRIRDETWLLSDTGDRSRHRALWTDVVRRVEPPYLPAPASLLGFLCWRQGETALGLVVLGQALAVDPGYTMALLLTQALAAGMPPDAWSPRRPPAGRDDGERT